MPEKKTLQRAQRARRQGKRPTTQASEFVREEIHHVREGKHGARSPQQAIAIGLSKARRAGIKLGPAPKKRTRKTARRAGSGGGRSAVSREALARQARQSAKQRGGPARRRAARKAVETKGAEGRRAAARKAAVTRKAA